MRPPLMLLASSPLTLYDNPDQCLIHMIARDGIGRIYQFVLKIYDEFTLHERLSINVYRQDDDGKEWLTVWSRFYEEEITNEAVVYWNDNLELVTPHKVQGGIHTILAIDADGNDLFHGTPTSYQGHFAWKQIVQTPADFLQRVLTVAAL